MKGLPIKIESSIGFIIFMLSIFSAQAKSSRGDGRDVWRLVAYQVLIIFNELEMKLLCYIESKMFIQLYFESIRRYLPSKRRAIPMAASIIPSVD